MKSLSEQLRKVWSFSIRDQVFILFAMLCGFWISCDYAIVRPVSNSVFIAAYSSKFFPYAWIAAVPLNFCLVALYNKYLPRLGCWRIFLITAGLIVLGNCLGGMFLDQFSSFPFVLYVWKEVYIMLMFQQLWSVIHATMAFTHAKFLYGILFAAGGLGGVVGSLITSHYAVALGSQNLLFASMPVYLLLGMSYYGLLKQSAQGKMEPDEKGTTSISAFKHGVGLILKSPLLRFILISVTCMQISATFVDYQFNSALEVSVPVTDFRTAYMARILSIVHFSTVILQLCGSFALIHFLGIRRTHFLIPSFLGIIALAFLCLPILPIIALSYIAVKSFDFSLFGVAKEMLYIPLERDEKFRAKAVIDVFAYRASKAFASLLILALQVVLGVYLGTILAWIGVGLFALWWLAVKYLFNGAADVKHG